MVEILLWSLWLVVVFLAGTLYETREQLIALQNIMKSTNENQLSINKSVNEILQIKYGEKK